MKRRGGVRRREILVLAVMSAALLTGHAPARVKTYTMQSSSMKPAIAPGDQIRVELDAKCCQRRSIIVYNPRQAWGRNDYVAADVKRVIALPGETISECEAGRVCIDGRPLQEPYVTVKPRTTSFGGTPPGCAPTSPPNACLVPEGSYFVMGDNRQNSFDSRAKGPVASTTVIGTVEAS